jgi:hypothetical protein
MKPRPVLIEWRDSTHWEPGRWVDLDELDGSACDVITVGWLVDRTKTDHVICSSITEAGDGTGVFVIPNACIVRCEPLKGGGGGQLDAT